MFDERALRIAQLIKLFGASMTATSTEEHLDHALSFNALFDEHLNHEPDEGASDLAIHICRALTPSLSLEIDAELYASVLTDLLYILTLQIDPRDAALHSSTSRTPRIPQGLLA